jgi:transcription termination/antitermination protein NusA
MSRDFVGALLQLNAEKQVSREQLIHTVEDAIAAAYRRVANEEDIHVQIDADSGQIRVYRARIATNDPIDEDQQLTHFTLDEAKTHKADAIPGELVEIEQLDGDTFGRIGAQTAKQVVLQRLREAERDAVFDQFADREGELVTGTVNRVEPRAMILDMGKGVEGILATTEQSPLEHYRVGQNVKAYVLEVRRTPRGPALFVSRTHKGFLKRLFELEVPEIHNGTVEVRAIAREAGSRSKVAVASRQDGLDPVGATVGQRGARVQAVVAELGGEKIDVIPWNDDPSQFVANALSPAQVLSVDIDQEHRIANVTVPERMLSLAIGREGQNARLAARLTGWRIDIRSDVSVAEAKAAATEAKTVEAPAEAGTDAVTGAATDAPTESVTEPAEADVQAVEAVAAGEADPADADAKPAKATKAKAPAAKTTKTTKTTKAKAADAETQAPDDGAAPAESGVTAELGAATAEPDGADAPEAELATAPAGRDSPKPRAKRTKAAAGEVAS